ncbi:MAG: cache domain-containing protein [Polyangiales bacterium]
MKFRRSAPAILIASVVVVVAAMTFLTNRLFSGLTGAVEEGQFALMRSSVETSLRDEAVRALARAELVAQNPSVRAAFAARDRDRLLAETRDMYVVQHERYGIDQMAFHVPPATIFLRVHNPPRAGDNVGVIRPIVETVNRTRAAQRGLAFSISTGPGTFGIVPVRDAQGNHVGSLEVGVDIGPMIDGLKARFGVEATLFVDERQLRQFSSGLGGEVFSEQNRVGRYLKFHSTNWGLMQRLVRPSDIAVASADAVTYPRGASGRDWGVLLLPVSSASGAHLGVVAVARDFSATRAAAGRSLVWQLLLAVFAVVVLSAMVLIVLRGVLLQPLAQVASRLAALAAGGEPPPVDDVSRECEEIRALAQSYEALRLAAGHPPAAPRADDEGDE